MLAEITDTLSKLIGAAHAQHLQTIAERMPEQQGALWLEKMARYLTETDRDLAKIIQYKHKPVSVREFMLSPYYLNKRGELYPVVLKDLEELNSGRYDEAVLTGGIGAAKTSIALYSQAYQIYLLSCLRNPHAVFGLDRSTEIKIIFQNLNAKLAKGVDYNRFRSLMSGAAYFKQNFAYDEKVESIIKFPNRIEIEPVAGIETGAIGQNVIGGIIDEINFMAVVEGSKQSAEGGTYDQATALYNTIARRRKSRFIKSGQALPGLLCLVSSKKVPGQFTDRKEEEAKTNKRIFVYNKRVWDVKPEGTFSGAVFHVFIGDESRQPRMLRPGEILPDEDRHLIDTIPMEFHQDFIDDITKALRDIAGKSTLAIHPYMPNRQAVVKNFGRRKNLFATECIDFSKEKLKLRTDLIALRPKMPRWVHIDLGLTSDSAGLAIGHCPGFTWVDRGGSKEQLPIIELDGVLEIVPPKGAKGEIDFSAIRRVLYKLREMGFPLKWCSLDTYQSADTIQILRQQGFAVGIQSMDTSMMPYDIAKQALYDERVVAPEHKKLLVEYCSLERNFRKGKVDHPAHGSKDLSDSATGVIFGLTTRREVWALHKVPLQQSFSIASIIRDKEHESGRSAMD